MDNDVDDDDDDDMDNDVDDDGDDAVDDDIDDDIGDVAIKCTRLSSPPSSPGSFAVLGFMRPTSGSPRKCEIGNSRSGYVGP